MRTLTLLLCIDPNLQNSRQSLYVDDRVWYDQFTSIDWVHDSIADAFRVKALHSRKDWRGRIQRLFDGAQGWLVVFIIGLLTACLAYFVTVSETVIFDYKTGYCSYSWSSNKKQCCQGTTQCDEWRRWSNVIMPSQDYSITDSGIVDYAFFVAFALLFALASCVLTLTTKTVVPSNIHISTLDENLGADDLRSGAVEPKRANERPAMVYYSAAGSGVAEIRVIVSGFVLHGYLGLRTLVIKSLALVLSIGSGLSIGKEGPYVHIATCIGNIVCRFFYKYRENDGKRREILSASAASGVAVAFGAPISGVLFSLEEVSYYFPSKTLFRTFFCCITAALSLKFLNPYGTNKIVLFEVRYITDWYSFEMIVFVFLGIMGGVLGALFIKATKLWAQTFRRIPTIKKYPLVETALIALATGLVTWWNKYTRLPVTELLLELASPCDAYTSSGTTMCPTKEHIPSVIWYLLVAFIIKAVLTTISFGIKVPAGIYVPSMVVGGLLGRIVGHALQYLALSYGHTGLFGACSADSAPEDCVVPGVYAMVAAGATMCGVTRLTVTLATILFELTGSLDHVLPFSIGVLVSKWTADAIEPLSIYDLLTDMNSYPFLDNKVRPVFTGELGDIVPRQLRVERIIDITGSVLIPAKELRGQVETLHMAGELDGGLPIVKDGALVGLIPAPDLEFALDRLENESKSLCLMSREAKFAASTGREHTMAGAEVEEDDRTDFTAFIDPAPVRLDVHSPMDLVYECFVKLGLRYICAVREGKYAGMVSTTSSIGKGSIRLTKISDT
jgi:chloride channel 3/4/5